MFQLLPGAEEARNITDDYAVMAVNDGLITRPDMKQAGGGRITALCCHQFSVSRVKRPPS